MKKTTFLNFIFIILINTANAQWVTQDLSALTTDPFSTVFFSDSLHGWLGDANGTILHTSDQGANWVLQNSNISSEITGIYFSDSTRRHA